MMTGDWIWEITYYRDDFYPGSVPDLPCADDAPTSNLIQTTIGLYIIYWSSSMNHFNDINTTEASGTKNRRQSSSEKKA